MTQNEYIKLDWSLRDIDLARLTGKTRERIRQMRNALHKKRSPMHRQKWISVQFYKNIEQLRGLSYAEMSQKMKCSYHSAFYMAKKYNIPVGNDVKSDDKNKNENEMCVTHTE